MIVSFNKQSGVSIRRVFLAMAALFICSKISIPMYPVPLTMQTFAVYSIGLLLSPREAFSAVLGWLLVGTFGFPVFASPVCFDLVGPTAGYRVGMLLGAPICALLLARGCSTVLSCCASYAMIYLFGCMWLSTFVGWESVVQFGILPFIISELLRMSVACGVGSFFLSRSKL